MSKKTKRHAMPPAREAEIKKPSETEGEKSDDTTGEVLNVAPKPRERGQLYKRISERFRRAGHRIRQNRQILFPFWLIQLFIIASCLLALVLIADRTIIDEKKLIVDILVLILTISLVNLTWHIAVKQEEVELLNKERELIISRVAKLMEIDRTSVLGVEDRLNLTEYRVRDVKDEIFIVKIYLPDAHEFFGARLRRHVLDGAVKKITLVLLDNREGTDGARLHEERAETMPFKDRRHYISNVRESILAVCAFAQGIVNEGLLTEFNLYMCNQLPTISITQLREDQTYLAFFFYSISSVQSPQILVNLGSRDDADDGAHSKPALVKAYRTHQAKLLEQIKQEHKQQKNGLLYIYNLLDLDQIKALEQQQYRIDVNSLRDPDRSDKHGRPRI